MTYDDCYPIGQKRERVATNAPYLAWMVSGQETVRSWVPLPKLTILVVSSVAFLPNYVKYLLTLFYCIYGVNFAEPKNSRAISVNRIPTPPSISKMPALFFSPIIVI